MPLPKKSRSPLPSSMWGRKKQTPTNKGPPGVAPSPHAESNAWRPPLSLSLSSTCPFTATGGGAASRRCFPRFGCGRWWKVVCYARRSLGKQASRPGVDLLQANRYSDGRGSCCQREEWDLSTMILRWSKQNRTRFECLMMFTSCSSFSSHRCMTKSWWDSSHHRSC